MGKKFVYSVLIFFFIICGFLAYLKFFVPNNQDGLLLRIKISIFNENKLSVTGDGVKLDDDLIRVNWEGEFERERIVWENGKNRNSIPNEYGPQRFTVFYNNQKIGKTSHFKTNNWHTHNYRINLHYIDANYTIGFDFNADGPNQSFQKNIHQQ